MIFIMCFSFLSSKAKLWQNDQSLIIGTWISEQDSKSKWVFSSDLKCKSFYNGVLKNTYTYKISNTNQQCGKEVHVDSKTSYLELSNISDSTDKLCYEINGFHTDENGVKTLSLMPLEQGGYMIFVKNS